MMDFDNVIQIGEHNRELLCEELSGDVLLYINLLLSLNNVYFTNKKIKGCTIMHNRDNQLGNYPKIIKYAGLIKLPILVSHIEISNSGSISCHMYKISYDVEDSILLNIRTRKFNTLLNVY